MKKLKSLGGGTDLVTIGRRTYLRSVPGELNMDKNKVLELAQVLGAGVGAGLGRKRTWEEGRRLGWCRGVLGRVTISQ